MPESDLKPVPLRDAFLATTLTWNGGFVDAFGYLVFYETFPGTMSGNAIAAGIDFARHGGPLVPVYLSAIVIFLAGITLGSMAIQLGTSSGLRRLLAITMAIEVVCLAALVPLEPSLPDSRTDAASSVVVYASLGLIALGMGVQNTSLRAAGVMKVYTTHVTGTVSRLGDDIVAYIASRRAWRRHSGAKPSMAPLILGTVMCLAYVAGACLGAYGLDELGWVALVAPVGVAAAVAACDLVAPFADRRNGSVPPRRR